MRADTEIRSDMESQLQCETVIDDSLIGVIVRGGIVTLTGEVGHYGAKWAAEEVAKRIPGVRAIANEIHVKLHEREAPSDTDIAEAVANTLSDALAVDRIQCVVQNGIVTLSGHVPRGDQKRAVEDVVRRLTGVKGILNSIMTTSAS